MRRLPRIALPLLGLTYVLAGFLGRDPWRNADITAFGFMRELAAGASRWLEPTLLGERPEIDALLPYWLGAWALKAAPAWIAPDLAVRIPFMLLLGLAFVATWYGAYHLMRADAAQPVAFAFGGEARPTDYARALADGAALALMACLGLAQLSHETTPALVQLAATCLIFYGQAALSQRAWLAPAAFLAGMAGLGLSGAPTVAALLGLGALALNLRPPTVDEAPSPVRQTRRIVTVALSTSAALALFTLLDLWVWRLGSTPTDLDQWKAIGRLFLWFTWPAWPLSLWTLWQWRRQLARIDRHAHLAWPLWIATVSAVTTLLTPASDRSLLLALPALATLAALSLPTLGRSVSALVDWFTLLFFSGCAIVIWVVWIAMQTGVPRQPAANVARLAPGFAPSFSLLPFVIAALATVFWIALVRWRAGRHRAAIWKSLVLPAVGALLCWSLLMTLWLPLLNHARSYVPLMQRVVATVGPAACVKAYGLSAAQVTALGHHGAYAVVAWGDPRPCPWLIADGEVFDQIRYGPDAAAWVLVTALKRSANAPEEIVLFKAASPR